tara:strand:- start:107 stop:628 length:522 start_codon:yes stop_codon:yes gene_type:complete
MKRATLIPLATLCIIQALGLIGNTVYAATKEWPFTPVKAGMIRHCREVDQPIAGLLTDLKQRGQLEETLVVWASEMGRTPFRNGGLGKNPGREHNSQGLCMWMAGGDVKGGATAGETDDFSLRSAGEAIHIRDVHTTLLNLMGLDDEKLEYRQSGRRRKLTDIGGNILNQIIT